MTKVLLYSGGMDSVGATLLWKPDVRLYVNMHTRYSDAESKRLDAAVTLVELPLTAWERDDAIIPLRNLYLVALATNYGDRVALGATAGDRVLDKSYEFAQQMTGLLSYLWQEQHWTPGRNIDVELPLKHMTKREIVEAVEAEHGADGVAQLARSFSCYDPAGDTECGACKPCRRKWIAFAATGHADLVVDARAAVTNNELREIETDTWTRGDKEADDLFSALANTKGT